MKKNTIFRISLCLTGVFLAAMPFQQAQAVGRNAGVIAVLEETLKVHNAQKVTTAANTTEVTAQKSASQKSASKTTKKKQETSLYGYKNLGVANVTNHLNIREGAGEEYDLAGKLPVDAGCDILEKKGEWYKIKSGQVTGYVKGEFLLTGKAAIQRADKVKSEVATINTQTVYLRTEPNTKCTIWAAMPEGEELEIISKKKNWLKVNLDGDECYVAKEYADISYQLEKAQSITEMKYGEGISDVRVDMVAYALDFVGNEYEWGGTSLTGGVDCSGYTMRIYEKYGIYLPHSSRAQPNSGTKIDSSQAKPGDLFFYGSGGSINHVAIYIGNGQVVHASSEKTGIKISNAFYREPICVVSYL